VLLLCGVAAGLGIGWKKRKKGILSGFAGY
jgi:hypothetical protein